MEALVIILTLYVETNETMAINKFQRSRLTLCLSYWSPINILDIVFSQTICPIELKFYVKTPYDKLAKIYTKHFGHMTKMTATPIYGSNPLKIFSRTRRPMTLGLGM